MSSSHDSIDILDAEECWRLLRATSVGRVAVDVAGEPDIFPINYVCDGETIVFRSGAGTKLAAAVLLHRVAFEIDGYDPSENSAWSVVIKGNAHEIEGMTDVFEAEELPLFPWAANPKPNFVRIMPKELSGRRFHVVDTATVDHSIGWEQEQTSPDAVLPEPGAEHHPGATNIRPG